MNSNSQAASVDIGRIIDDGPFTRLQRFIVFVVAMAVVIDGFDSQLIGFAIPLIGKEWGISKGAFAPVIAAGLLGMGVGSALAGLFGDRYGRRWGLIGSVLIFGISTSAIGLSPNLRMIAVLRFFAGLGIGGALPTSTTMAAEYTPLRLRTLAVTATIVCVPLGGMFAGIFGGVVLPHSGWRPLFLIGGAFPLMFAIALMIALPESPRYLARHRERWPELTALLWRLRVPTPGVPTFTDQAEQKDEHGKGLSALVQADYRRDSFALWSAFFMCMLAIYSAFSWLPTMLTSEGLGGAIASSGLTVYNLGGVLGALFCAFAIARYGSRGPILACCAGGAISALLLAQLPLHEHATALIAGLGIHGFFVNAVQSTMWALCAQVYPTVVRATGTATAGAFGRIGAMVSSFAGAAAMAAGGGSAYLSMLGIAMIFVFAAVASMRRHVPSGVGRSGTAIS